MSIKEWWKEQSPRNRLGIGSVIGFACILLLAVIAGTFATLLASGPLPAVEFLAAALALIGGFGLIATILATSSGWE